VCDPDDACDADGLPDEAGLPDVDDPADDDDLTEAGADAWAVVLVPPGDVALGRAEVAPECPWPVGDGVRVPG
jgi:hypothetical protein